MVLITIPEDGLGLSDWPTVTESKPGSKIPSITQLCLPSNMVTDIIKDAKAGKQDMQMSIVRNANHVS